METCEQQNFRGFEDESRLSQQASRANQRVLPGSDEARKMTVGSGRQLSMLLDSSNPLGAFSRILLESPHFASSREYCYNWEVWDTRLDCSAFRLTQSAQSTSDTESLLWQTPVADDAVNRAKGKINSRGEPKLSAQVKLFPMPAARDYRSPNVKPYSERGGGTKGEQLPNFLGGSLNPGFVEELMGYEIDHTALRPSETPSSPNKPTRSSRRSRKLKAT